MNSHGIEKSTEIERMQSVSLPANTITGSSLSPSYYPSLTPSRQSSIMPSIRAHIRNPTSYPTEVIQ